MTKKDDFHASAQEMNKKSGKGTTGAGAGASAVAARPPTPLPPGPKPPFGMPVMPPAAQSVKRPLPAAPPPKAETAEEPAVATDDE